MGKWKTENFKAVLYDHTIHALLSNHTTIPNGPHFSTQTAHCSSNHIFKALYFILIDYLTIVQKYLYLIFPMLPK